MITFNMVVEGGRATVCSAAAASVSAFFWDSSRYFPLKGSWLIFGVDFFAVRVIDIVVLLFLFRLVENEAVTIFSSRTRRIRSALRVYTSVFLLYVQV